LNVEKGWSLRRSVWIIHDYTKPIVTPKKIETRFIIILVGFYFSLVRALAAHIISVGFLHIRMYICEYIYIFKMYIYIYISSRGIYIYTHYSGYGGTQQFRVGRGDSSTTLPVPRLLGEHIQRQEKMAPEMRYFTNKQV
jgi:hypothetical protein